MKVGIVGVGGDHRFVAGWSYGLTEFPGQREQIRGAMRVANPGCFPSAALLARQKASVAFTPHLVPMTRGILASCYARPKGTLRPEHLYEAAEACYRDEPFIKFLPAEQGRSAHTRQVAGSNLAFVSYTINSHTGLVFAFCAIDNLGKGASAQALQNANLMVGRPEPEGLSGLP